MSMLNVSLALTAYADALKNVNPSVKFTDLKWSMLGLPTDQPQMHPIALNPGQTLTIASLTRTLSFSGSTSFVVSLVSGTSDAQLVTAFGQRTARTYGDATTQWALTRTNTLVTAHWTGTGSAPNFSTMSVGDGVTLGSPFTTFNQGDFTVVGVSVSGAWIEFINPIGVNETLAGLVDVYSSGPVQVGDILDVTDTHFSYPNQGQFKISRVTDRFVQFTNPQAVAETVTSVSNLVIYPVAAKWVLIACDQRLIAQFNGESGTGCEIEPPVAADLLNNPGLLLKRGKLYQLVLTNPGQAVAGGMVFLAE